VKFKVTLQGLEKCGGCTSCLFKFGCFSSLGDVECILEPFMTVINHRDLYTAYKVRLPRCAVNSRKVVSVYIEEDVRPYPKNAPINARFKHGILNIMVRN
jgi:hypothetical protein